MSGLFSLCSLIVYWLIALNVLFWIFSKSIILIVLYFVSPSSWIGTEIPSSKYLVNCLKPLSPELFNFAKEVDVMTPLEIETKRKIKRREEYEKRKIRRRIT